MYTSANLLLNIFNETGWVLREIQGGARSLVVHGLYVIDSNANRSLPCMAGDQPDVDVLTADADA